jgi:hypothetical protein
LREKGRNFTLMMNASQNCENEGILIVDKTVVDNMAFPSKILQNLSFFN